MHLKSVVLSFVLAGIIATVIGCGPSGRLRFDSPQQAFDRGMEAFERGRYSRAIEHFQAVFDFGRAHELAADAQFYLAESYFHNREYLLAANEYTRFLEFYRADPRAADVEFGRAMSYYRLSPPYQLDQTDTERAITYLNLFATRYPQSERREEAAAMITELREKLARKQFEAARLYERRDFFEAAALTYESVLDRYPETSFVEPALVGAIRNYIAFADVSVRQRQPERLQRAIDTFNRFEQLFPNSPHMAEARAMYNEARARMEVLVAERASPQ